MSYLTRQGHYGTPLKSFTHMDNLCLSVGRVLFTCLGSWELPMWLCILILLLCIAIIRHCSINIVYQKLLFFGSLNASPSAPVNKQRWSKQNLFTFRGFFFWQYTPNTSIVQNRGVLFLEVEKTIPQKCLELSNYNVLGWYQHFPYYNASFLPICAFKGHPSSCRSCNSCSVGDVYHTGSRSS